MSARPQGGARRGDVRVRASIPWAISVVLTAEHERRLVDHRRLVRMRVAGEPERRRAGARRVRSRRPRSRRPTIAKRAPSWTRQFNPAGDDRAGEVAVPDENHVPGFHVVKRQTRPPCRRVRRPAARFRRLGSRASTPASRAPTCGFPLSSGLRTRRNPIADSGETSSMVSPASSAVSRARRNGLLTTHGWSSSSSRSASPTVLARSRPASVRSRSVRLVCCPDRDHSVSPWRNKTSRCCWIVTR